MANVTVPVNGFTDVVFPLNASEAVNLTVAWGGSFYSGEASALSFASSTSIGNIVLNAKADSSVYADFLAANGSLAAANGTIINAGASAYVQVNLSATTSMGNVSVKAAGSEAYTSVSAYAAAGNIGAIKISATGADASNALYAMTGNGSIGNVEVLAAAGRNLSGAIADASVSAVGGGVGNITVTAKNDSEAEASVSASGFVTEGNVARVGNIGAVTVNAFSNSAYATAYVSSNGILSEDGTVRAASNIGNVTVNVAGGYAGAYVEANAYSGGSIARLTVNVTGYHANGFASGYVETGNIGDVSVNVAGYYASGHVGAWTSYGNIGNVTATAGVGASAYANIWASGGNVGGVSLASRTNGSVAGSVYASGILNGAGTATVGGSVGNVSITANGVEASASAYIESNGTYSAGASTILAGGNIGAITLNATGEGAWASVSAYAYSGGAIGSINATATGAYSHFDATIYAEAGNIGNITGAVNGSYASGYLDVNAGAASAGSSVAGGNIGPVTLRANGLGSQIDAYVTSDGTFNSGDSVFRAGGNIGGITLGVTGYQAQGYLNVDAYSGGSIGAINVTSNGAYTDATVSAYTQTGNVGPVSIVANGVSAYASAYVVASAGRVLPETGNATAVGGSIGNVTLSVAGTYAGLDATFRSDGVFNDGSAYIAAGNIGATTVRIDGYGSSGNVNLAAWSGGSIGGLNVTVNGEDASAFANAFTQYGNIGAISLVANGAASLSNFSAYANGGVTNAGLALGGNIGPISLTANGAYARAEGWAYSDGVFSQGESYLPAGNIGAVTLNTTGYESSVEFGGYAYSGGNVGNVTANINGDRSYGYIDVWADSGNIGSVTANATGFGASLDVSAYAAGATNAAGSLVGGVVGPITLRATGTESQINLGVDAYGGLSAGSFTPGSNIGAINVTVNGTAATSTLDVEGHSGANVGSVTVNITGINSSSYTNVSAYAGNIGNISVAGVGRDSDLVMNASSVAVMDSGLVVRGGTVGSITLSNRGASSYMTGGVNTYGVFSAGGAYVAAGNIGAISLNVSGPGAEGYFVANAYSGGNIGPVTAVAGGDRAALDVYTTAEFGNIGALSVTATGLDSSASLYAYAGGGETDSATMVGGRIGNVTMAATGEGSDVRGYFVAQGTFTDLDTNVGIARIGDLIMNVTGSNASGYASLNAYNGGSIGNITTTATGESVETWVSADAIYGNVGSVSISGTGLRANVMVSAYASGGLTSDSSVLGGNIGNVTLNVTGGYSSVSADLEAVGVSDSAGSYVGGGNIGAISMSLNGAGAYGSLDAHAQSGGSIGNVSLTLKGEKAWANLNLETASGGDIGTISINSQGGMLASDSGFSLNVQTDGTEDSAANIGTTTINITNTTSMNGGDVQLEAYSGGIGAISFNVTGGYGGWVSLSAISLENDAGDLGGTIGDISLSNTSTDGSIHIQLQADNSIGNISAAGGAGTSIVEIGMWTGVNYVDPVYEYVDPVYDDDGYLISDGYYSLVSSGYVDGLHDVDTAVGNITVTISADQRGYAGYVGFDLDNTSTVSDVRVTGGSSESIFYVGGETNYGSSSGADALSVASVNLSSFLGFSEIDLRGVTNGTNISASQAGSYIYGTEGADTITLSTGTAVDTIVLDDTPTSGVDVITNFTVGEGGDILDVYGTDLALYTTNPGITTTVSDGAVLGLVGSWTTATALEDAFSTSYSKLSFDDGAEATFVTAITGNSSATGGKTLYVFDYYDADSSGTVDSGEVTLIGTLTATGGVASLTSDNFA